jgi:hypothetical protein
MIPDGDGEDLSLQQAGGGKLIVPEGLNMDKGLSQKFKYPRTPFRACPAILREVS